MYALALFGVAWAPGLPACNLRGRRGTWSLPRGLMYALALFGVAWGVGTADLQHWVGTGDALGCGWSRSFRHLCLAGVARGDTQLTHTQLTYT